MPGWRLDADATGQLRLEWQSEARREMGSTSLTWAELLYARLLPARVLVIYFPSRTDATLDAACGELLRTFGANTPKATSVNFWDPRDGHFSRALSLFGVQTPPAVVLVSGLEQDALASSDPQDADLYCISFAGRSSLADTERLGEGINSAHEVLMRANRGEIVGYLRRQDHQAVLATLGRIATIARDQLVQLKPKMSLPNGVSVSLG